MKLTLAMGLQFDNGKQASAVALSLGRDKQASMQAEQQPMQTVLVQSESVRAETGQRETGHFNQSSIIPSKKSEALFFLTYNLKGLNDTLVFENALVDLYI